MKKCAISISVALVFLFLAMTSSVFGQDCRQYLEKGYCVDYIKQVKRKKQSGNAGTWSSNIDAKSVQPGDVAIFSSPAPYGHVAIVEQVIYEKNTDKPYQIKISEWNWGSASSDANKKACAVTTMFNTQSTRTVRVNIVKGYWRP